jgi:lipoate-protein ligase A
MFKKNTVASESSLMVKFSPKEDIGPLKETVDQGEEKGIESTREKFAKTNTNEQKVSIKIITSGIRQERKSSISNS